MLKLTFLKDKTNRELFLLIVAILLGGFVGVYFPHFMSSIEWMGKIFMNSLLSLVLPLIFFALVSAVTSMGNINKLGKLGLITIIVILVNVGIASFIGLMLALVFKPGHGIDANLLIQGFSSQTLKNSGAMSFSDFIVSMFPPNLGEIAIKSQILPIVVFSVFFSIIATKNSENNAVQAALKVCVGFRDILMDMLKILMKVTPIAMFALIGNAIASSLLSGHFYTDILGISKFIFIFLLGCFLLCILQFIIVFILLGRKSFIFFEKTIKSSATGLATSSSMATLPIMLLSAHEAKIDDAVSKFALPLTVVFNLGSSALYVAAATVFVSQVLHTDISGWNIAVIYVTTVLTGLGTTGIPNAGFIATMTVLKTISVPTSAIAILFPIDTILSRIRTAVNVWGHLVCASVIDFIIHRALVQKNSDKQ